MLKSILKKILIALILLIALSSNSLIFGLIEKNPNYLRNKLKHAAMLLSLDDYTDALREFMDVYSASPTSKEGEMAFLYIAKTYALENYKTGNVNGVFGAINTLNLYTFYYKIPHYLDLQNKFIGEIYIMIGFYKRAAGAFLKLYEKTKNPLYAVYTSYALLLNNDISGYSYIQNINPLSLPNKETAIYYECLALYNMLENNYISAITYLLKAKEYYRALSFDPDYLFMLGYSFYKTNDIKDAELYLELCKMKDVYGKYKDKLLYVLSDIYLKKKDYKSLKKYIKDLTKNGVLFYDPIKYIVYSSFWLDNGFVRLYLEPFYKRELDKLMWMRYPSFLSSVPAFGLLSYFIDQKLSKQETKDFYLFWKTKEIRNKTVLINGINISLERYINAIKQKLNSLDPYSQKDTFLLHELYSKNPKNMSLFLDSNLYYKLTRAFLYLGDPKGAQFLADIDDINIRTFLQGEYALLNGDYIGGINLIKSVYQNLKGDDFEEATFLVGYYSNNLDMLKEFLSYKNLLKSRRLNPFYKIALIKAANMCYEQKDYQDAFNYYLSYIRSFPDKKSEFYWFSMYRLAELSSLLKNEKVLKYILEQSKNVNNIWAKSIEILWGS